jgi:hypothetical protein
MKDSTSHLSSRKPEKQMITTQDNKLLKARLIIAKLIASQIFTDWECRADVLEMIQKINDDLSLGINPGSVMQTMIEMGVIKASHKDDYNRQYYDKSK